MGSGRKLRGEPLEPLGAQLRAIRNDHGLAREKVALVMEWSTSKLARIEGGEVGIDTNDLRSLLRHYGIDGQRAEELITLARADRARRRTRQLAGVRLEPSA